MENSFQIMQEHKEWASRANRKTKPRKGKQWWEELIKEQGGACALTGAPMLFDKKSGTAPCHPLYASVDHVKPTSEEKGLQIVCYAVNDLKGHLPPILFNALTKTKEWKRFAKRWKESAKRTKDIEVFKRLIREGQ